MYNVYKENYPFRYSWVEFFFPKILLIFNTNNTCNKHIRINSNIKTNETLKNKCNKHDINICISVFFLYQLKNITN